MSINIDSSALVDSYAKLGVLGKNIANENTVGYKSASFQQVLSQSTNYNNMQNFSQGGITTDNKPLDVAINGNGFFKLLPLDPSANAPSASASAFYTRDGQFTINSNGYLTDSAGNFVVGTEGPIKIPNKSAPVASTTGSMELNLDANATVIPATTTFNPTDSSTYNYSTTATMYDGQGNTSTITSYFAKTAANTWNVYSTNSATPSTPATKDATLTFNTNGQLVSALGGKLVTVTAPVVPVLGGTSGEMKLNLNSAVGIPINTTFNPTNSSTYNYSTTSTLIDAQGNSSTETFYFVKTASGAVAGATPATPDTWNVYSLNSAVGSVLSAPTALSFDVATGTLSPAGSPTITDKGVTFTLNPTESSQPFSAATTAIPGIPLTTNAQGNSSVTIPLPNSSGGSIPFTLDAPTQYSKYFSASSSTNGCASGLMTTCTIGTDGTLLPQYEYNGTSVPTPLKQKIELVTFANNTGLQPTGTNKWVETIASGKPTTNIPGSAGFGSLQAGATEGSNVDPTAAMVDLLSAQRTFQAQSQVVNTESQILQEITQLGR